MTPVAPWLVIELVMLGGAVGWSWGWLYGALNAKCIECRGRR